MKARFNYNDVVVVQPHAAEPPLIGRKGWIVGVFESSLGKYFEQFPPGVVYSIEFEDGTSTEVHERDLIRFSEPS